MLPCPAVTERFTHNTTIMVVIKGSEAMRLDGVRNYTSGSDKGFGSNLRLTIPFAFAASLP